MRALNYASQKIFFDPQKDFEFEKNLNELVSIRTDKSRIILYRIESLLRNLLKILVLGDRLRRGGVGLLSFFLTVETQKKL